MTTCLISLGSNLGQRREQLEWALEQLAQQAGLALVHRSSWYETAPVGGPPGQGPFLNGAALLETSLSADGVLDVLLRIEAAAGRHRRQHWEARTLDLDLLLYDAEVIRTPRLRVPHPRMAFRRFVLEPAAEIAGYLTHPETGWTIAHLLEHLNQAYPLVMLSAPPGVDRSGLAGRLARAVGGRTLLAPPSWEVVDRVPRGGLQPWMLALHEVAPLAEEPSRTPDAAVMVANFWWEQLLLAATLELEGPTLEEFHLSWAQHSPLRPKLLIYLDASPRWLARQFPSTDAERPTEPWLARYRAALRSWIETGGGAPVLDLDAERPAAELVAEMLAAVQAMQ